jgi:hypothetical protein
VEKMSKDLGESLNPFKLKLICHLDFPLIKSNTFSLNRMKRLMDDIAASDYGKQAISSHFRIKNNAPAKSFAFLGQAKTLSCCLSHVIVEICIG